MAYGNITTVQAEKYLAGLYVLNSGNESLHNGVLQSFDVKSSTGNKAAIFTKMKVGSMKKKTGVAAKITADLNEFEFVNCPVTSRVSRVPCDVLEDDKAQFNEIMATTKNMAQKIYNEKVIELVDVLDTTTTTVTAAATKTANLETILGALEKMNAKSIPSENRHAIIDAAGLKQLLLTTELTSSDYATVKALVRGEVNTAFGLKWHVLGDEYFANLTSPAAGAMRKMYIYQKDCIGMAKGKESVRVNYNDEIDSMVVVGGLNLGSCIIDELGVVSLTLSNK